MTTDLILIYGIVYKCTNLINGKIYIGQTVKGLQKRKNEHLNGKNDDNYFHRALRKYSNTCFKWEIITSASSKDDLNFLESFYTTIFNSYAKNGNGYNIAKGGNSGSKFEGFTEEDFSMMLLRKQQTWKNKTAKERAARNDKWKNTLKNLESTIKEAYIKTHRDACKLKNSSINNAWYEKSWAYYSDLTKEQEYELKNEQSKRIEGENNPMYGVHRFGSSNPNAGLYRCIELNILFNSLQEAANFAKCHKSNISESTRLDTMCRGYHWEKIKTYYRCIELNKLFFSKNAIKNETGLSLKMIERSIVEKRQVRGFTIQETYEKPVSPWAGNKGSSKPLVCVEDDLIFESKTKAAKHYNISPDKITYSMIHCQKTNIDKTFKYFEGDEK